MVNTYTFSTTQTNSQASKQSITFKASKLAIAELKLSGSEENPLRTQIRSSKVDVSAHIEDYYLK